MLSRICQLIPAVSHPSQLSSLCFFFALQLSFPLFVFCLCSLSAVGDLIRKVNNPKAFKGHVSPHEFLQAIATSSKKRFRITEQVGLKDEDGYLWGGGRRLLVACVVMPKCA